MSESCPPVGDSGTGGAGCRVGLVQVRAVVNQAAELLRVLSGILWQAGGVDLAEVLTELDQLVALAGAGRVAVTAEAVQRGEVASSQCAGTAGWVARHAPSLAGGPGAGQLATCVEHLRRSMLQPVKDAVLAGQLSVPVALVVVSEFDKLRGRIIPEAEPLVLAGLVDIGVQDGAREVRQLRPRLLAQHGAPGELQDEHDQAARQVALSHPVATDEGVWDYLLRVDAEGKAVLEAAIGPLSAPVNADRARDPRSAQQRRGQALLEVCRRVTAAAKAAGPFGGYPSPTGASGPTDSPEATDQTGRASTATATASDARRLRTASLRATGSASVMPNARNATRLA